jgi:hypothetical protein
LRWRRWTYFRWFSRRVGYRSLHRPGTGAGQYSSRRLQLNILVRCGTTWAAAMWRIRFYNAIRPRSFHWRRQGNGLKYLPLCNIRKGDLILIFGFVYILEVCFRGIGKKVALRSRALSCGSTHSTFVIGSFN